ncbi:trehalase-like [Hyalella azteca]|uniref:Trehalase n=1 Tax=Hyalella azteca TaxID=294128 RepID=A0A8B7P3F8_HYAAZ|nr:trehalase-like [Hyalella azteca]
MLICRAPYSVILFGSFLLFFPIEIETSVVFNASNDCVILCSGEILKNVQLSQLFNDSGYFVRMKLLADPAVIEQKFMELKNRSKNIDKNVLKIFVDEWFLPPGSDLESFTLPDWTEVPRFIEEIHDKALRNWMIDLNKIWKELAKKIPEDVKENSSLYSQIYLPNGFVIPGGFFQEIYYWDSYWIIEGLLISEMKTTARGMIENLLHLVKKYGYVPNGSRKYLLGRSQFPMLISITDLYYHYTRDFTIIRDNIDTLVIEYEFWVANRTVQFSLGHLNYTLFHYSVSSDQPRPESYLADNTLVQNVSETKAALMYGDIKAAAESGWDFSSRWFINNGVETEQMSYIETRVIAPVDLNSIMCRNAHLLSVYYDKLKNVDRSKYYREKAATMNSTISRLFWDEARGFWFDFNLETKELEKEFYGAGFVPLWARTFGIERNSSYVISKVINFLNSLNLTSFPGGVPASLISSEQQWDYPNGWAPLQYFAVVGLRKAAVYNADAGILAESLARKWVLNNYYGYINSSPHLMMEKYDVTHLGTPGSGGEYPVQAGFGWTNGVVMKFMHLYPHSIRTTQVQGYAPICVAAVLLLTMTTSLTLYVYRIRCSDTSSRSVRIGLM